ncbi:Outer membrane protein ImpK/VasF, OmpA/MotB domain [Candidatus Burkholderia humilis]|nr:Outer membrane protein ImpK/VasF, OmpA/MotB domain [Candidatus Burkholderia humilis]
MNSFTMSPIDTLRAQPAPLTPISADGDTLPRNRLIQHAHRLLDALVEVRLHTPAEASVLRDYLIREVRAFQALAHHAGLPAENIVAARYCLCTALDKVAALTPWGCAEAWSSNGLLVAFHNETWGSEKFFQLLARLSARPHLHIDLMELQVRLPRARLSGALPRHSRRGGQA